MKALLVSLLSLLICANASAQGVATFFYQRGAVHILRASPPPLPWHTMEEKPIPQKLDISVDIRPATSLTRQEGWINMGSLSGLSGMMFVYDRPEIAQIADMDYYQPLDIIWVDINGVITSIAPGMVLAGNREILSDAKPSKVLLMLAGGTAQQYGINPGDKLVESEFFKEPPKMLKSAL
jgi:uncharacterized membrane protein (UPF0127 family)